MRRRLDGVYQNMFIQYFEMSHKTWEGATVKCDVILWENKKEWVREECGFRNAPACKSALSILIMMVIGQSM